jgi:hypothetical protein
MFTQTCIFARMQQYEPNVPMRNRPEGESSTTTSSASWRNVDGFRASPVEDGVSISGTELNPLLIVDWGTLAIF